MPIHPALRASSLVLAFGSLLTLAACGGGGGSGGGDTTTTFTPSSAWTLHSDNASNGALGTRVGDDGLVGLRGGIRFPLFPFVDNTDVIVSAKLRVNQMVVTGAPYTQHGNVVVDFVDFGLALEATDYAAPVITANIGTLSSDATLGFKEIDVTAQVIAAAAGNDFFVDFILRSSALSVGGVADYAQFGDVSAGSNQPQLVVNYH